MSSAPLAPAATLETHAGAVCGSTEDAKEGRASFIERRADTLKCDAVVISDSAMFAPGLPSILSSLRGLAYFQIDLRGTSTDLHSGSFGGAVVEGYYGRMWLFDATAEKTLFTIPVSRGQRFTVIPAEDRGALLDDHAAVLRGLAHLEEGAQPTAPIEHDQLIDGRMSANERRRGRLKHPRDACRGRIALDRRDHGQHVDRVAERGELKLKNLPNFDAPGADLRLHLHAALSGRDRFAI